MLTYLPNGFFLLKIKKSLSLKLMFSFFPVSPSPFKIILFLGFNDTRSYNRHSLNKITKITIRVLVVYTCLYTIGFVDPGIDLLNYD